MQLQMETGGMPDPQSSPWLQPQDLLTCYENDEKASLGRPRTIQPQAQICPSPLHLGVGKALNL